MTETGASTGERTLLSTTYQIHIEYGKHSTWMIHRRIYDFFRLHAILRMLSLQGQVSVQLPHFPRKLSYLMDATTFKPFVGEVRRETRMQSSRERCEALQAYLHQLFMAMNMQPGGTEIYEFIECGMLNLIALDTSPRLKEGYLKNRIFERQPAQKWHSCLLNYLPSPKKYRTQWFLVRSTYIAFSDGIDKPSPSDVFLCDKSFHVVVENEHANQLLKPVTIKILNSSRKLEVRPESNTQISYWLDAFRRLALECIWCQPHRFGSFAPVRSRCRIDWLVDGEDYYAELVKAVQAAKKEIFLHGWWISPELHLIRPAAVYPQMRLDRLLQRKAREGVKIYIMIFKEVTMALKINSYHTKSSLEKLHPNIRVQRHPDYLGGPLYWAHHEKLVIIDQQVAFNGGLDLCFGRYDNAAHNLTDYHPSDSSLNTWTGMDYSNPRIKDFVNVDQHANSLVDRRSVPRMPWHDVHTVVYGQAACDLARHFIERWNFVKQQKSMHQEHHIPFLLPRGEFSVAELEALNFTGSVKLQIVRSVSEWSMGTAPETSIYDSYLHYIKHAQHYIYIENQFFVSCASEESQGTPVKNTIAQAIADRIIRAASAGDNFKVIVVLPLMPAFEAAVHRSEASSLRIIMQSQYSGISRGLESIIGRLKSQRVKPADYITFLSLRKHGYLEGKAVTEQLYVHSKLMIVDDKVAIIGSANINDRSMLGTRDSEVCMIVEDEELIDASFGGQHLKVARKVRELRMRLLQEHLGLLHLPPTDPLVQVLEDPTAPEFYFQTLWKQASLNTQIFREFFHCVPDDCARTWEEYYRFTEDVKAGFVNEDLGINSFEMLSSIRGNIVLFPMQFLSREDLSASLLTPEYLVPIEVYM